MGPLNAGGAAVAGRGGGTPDGGNAGGGSEGGRDGGNAGGRDVEMEGVLLEGREGGIPVGARDGGGGTGGRREALIISATETTDCSEGAREDGSEPGFLTALGDFCEPPRVAEEFSSILPNRGFCSGVFGREIGGTEDDDKVRGGDLEYLLLSSISDTFELVRGSVGDAGALFWYPGNGGDTGCVEAAVGSGGGAEVGGDTTTERRGVLGRATD